MICGGWGGEELGYIWGVWWLEITCCAPDTDAGGIAYLFRIEAVSNSELCLNIILLFISSGRVGMNGKNRIELYKTYKSIYRPSSFLLPAQCIDYWFLKDHQIP